MTMHNALYKRDSIERLHVLTKKRGRRFTSTENCLDTPIQVLEDYIKKRKKRAAGCIIKTSTKRNTRPSMFG